MIPFITMLWLVNSRVVWLSVTQLYSGCAWAGFNLCAGLFIWDAAPQENRIRYIAIFGATAGALIGGNLGPHLPEISGSYFLTLFLVSGILRLIFVLGLFRRIDEVRDVEPVKVTELLFGNLRPAAIANWRRRIRASMRW